MSSRPRATQADRKTGSGGRASAKRTQKRLNRAQQHAMDVRAAETRFMPVATPTDRDEETASPAVNPRAGAIASARAARTGARRVVARPVLMTHEEEYRYISEDMRRLIITAAILLVLMLIVLFVVER